MRSDGSSSLRNTASVALMMPAPTRTTSVSAAGPWFMDVLPSGAAVEARPLGWPGRAKLRGRPKRHRSAGCEHHISPPPGIAVDQLPAVAAAGSILGQQNIAGLEHEMIPAARLE